MHHYGLTCWGSLGCPVDEGFIILDANCDKQPAEGMGVWSPKALWNSYYADMLLLYVCSHLYIYGRGIELGLS